MNILIDTASLSNGSAIRGIGQYTKNLIKGLKDLNTQNKIFVSEENPEKTDLIHYPFFDFFFPTLPLQKRTRTIVTIHDVIPLVFAKHYPRGIRGNITLLRQKLALRDVTHIITDSQCSKRDIIHHLHIASSKISVVPLAASEDVKKQPQSVVDSVRKKYLVPKNYVLYVGDINYNKNLPFLIHSVSRIPKIYLVMVGKSMKNTSIPEGKAIEEAISKYGMKDRVILLDSLAGDATQELSALYTGATAYIQPSFYEGFGLPVLEAMQCQTPVISSCGGSLPEVVGNAAVTFHPHDENDCEAAIRKVLKLTPVQRQAMVRSGVMRAREFTWERTARETMAIYMSVFSSR
jgi:glycosyltransferase involved in cell wall biosynthesis